MACENCDITKYYPGKLVKVTKDLNHCAICGIAISTNGVSFLRPSSTWDIYFHSICIAVSTKSPCLSRKIGAILVRDHSIVSTGFNGPSRGIPHCGRDRILSDIPLGNIFPAITPLITRKRIDTECPRRLLGYDSGTHMELCSAQHAEENAVSNAARLGVSTVNTILYMNSIIPCKNCFGTLINAGIFEIVIDKVESYDIHTQYLIDNSSIKIRRFEL